MACPSCGSFDFESQPASGDTYCTHCGTVLEQNAIVSEITFGEASTGAAIVQGSFIGQDQTRARLFGPYRKQSSLESREVTLANGRRRITALALSLDLPERYIDAALRFFTLAVNANFTQGRRSQYVIASCLYIVCRMEKTSHMLIDFSDKLSINLFTLGSTFLRLIYVLNVKLPIVDPSLYTVRFASRLEFGNETHQVAADAARLIQRMNRDWMVQGRRPSGLCGAALIMAAHMNNFTRTVPEVVMVVKVADLTLKKRLAEFKQLPSANLTVNDFRSIVLEHSHDPPSFLQARAKEEKMKAKEEEEKKNNALSHNNSDKTSQNQSNTEDESIASKESTGGDAQTPNSEDTNHYTKTNRRRSTRLSQTPQSNGSDSGNSKVSSRETSNAPSNSKTSSSAENEENSTNTTEAEMMNVLHSEQMQTATHELQLAKSCSTEVSKEMSKEQSEKDVAAIVSELKERDPDDFGDIDEKEIDQLILSARDVEIKTEVWMKYNKEYLEEQIAKEKRIEELKKSGLYKDPKKRKRKKPRDSSTAFGATAADSAKTLLQQKTFSRKINYDALDSLFND